MSFNNSQVRESEGFRAVVVAQQFGRPPGMPTPHMVTVPTTHSDPASYGCARRTVEDGPNAVDPATHRGDPHRVPGSRFGLA